MSKANLKLRISFDFDLAAPAALTTTDHEALCRELHASLGSLVFQGMPTITGKQLARMGVTVVGHHHHLDVSNLDANPIERQDLIDAAPHLTDDELDRLGSRAAVKAPAASAERIRYLRRQALAMINEYRLVPCTVEAKLSSGAPAALAATLNLTNGSVMVAERDRQSRLQGKAGEIAVVVGDGEVRLDASYAGHTLSGPVIEVPVAEIARCRPALLERWQAHA
jgi:hypothetical protein